MRGKINFLLGLFIVVTLFAGLVLFTCKANTVFNVHRLAPHAVGAVLLLYIMVLAAMTLATIVLFFKACAKPNRFGARALSRHAATFLLTGLATYIVLLHFAARRYCD